MPASTRVLIRVCAAYLAMLTTSAATRLMMAMTASNSTSVKAPPKLACSLALVFIVIPLSVG